MLSGILNINKPFKLTSASVVGKVKHILNTRAVGHMGTLDPIGTGVLLLGVGKGTRLFDYYLSKSKTYEASFKFGSSYDTLDYTGHITNTTSIVPSIIQIKEILPTMIGQQSQMPPAFSAKSINGVRAYELARKGLEVNLKPSSISIDSIELIREIGENEYMFRIDCSSGTYIRSIARDLAFKLGSLAHMTSINRIRCGTFYLNSSISIEELTENDIIPLDIALASLPRFDVEDSFYTKLLNGVSPECDLMYDKFTLYCNNELFGIATNVNGKAKIMTYLKENK